MDVTDDALFVEESEKLLLLNKRAKRLSAARRLSQWVHKANPYSSFSKSYQETHSSEHRFMESAISMTGKKKAFKAGVWISGKPCTNVTWVSDSQVTCIVPAGVGHDLSVKVVSPVDGGIAAQIFSTELHASAKLSYDAPTVNSVSPSVGKAGDVLVV